MPWVVVDGLGDCEIAQRDTEQEALEIAGGNGGEDKCYVVEYREDRRQKLDLFDLDGE